MFKSYYCYISMIDYTPVDCQQFGKRSENVKGKLCLKVIIAIFP